MNSLLEMQKKVIKKIEEESKDQQIPAIFAPADEDMPFDTLNMILSDIGMDHTEVVGEFSFLKTDEKIQVATFAAVLTVSNQISTENIGMLYEAMSLLNFLLPYGAFSAYEKEHLLVFKLSSPITTTLKEEELYNQVQVLISNAYLIVDKYIDILIDISEGNNKIELIKELFGIE